MQWMGLRNPVSYGWFAARGGLRTHVLMGGGVLLVLSALVALTVILEGERSDRVWAGWAAALLVIQSVAIALVGGLGVANAIRSDAASGMHDSIRLMRLSSADVVAGYVIGASSQVWFVFVPCVVVGVIASAKGGVGAGPWAWALGMMLVSAWFWVVMAAWLGMMFKQAALLVVVSAIAAPMSLSLLQVVPAMALLYGPAAGAGVLDMRSSSVDQRLVLSVLAQVAVASVVFRAAARKFRHPDAMAMGVDLSLILVSLWAVMSLTGMLMWETVRPRWLSRSDLDETHIVASLITGMLVGLVVAAAVGRRTGERERRARLDGVAPPTGGRARLEFWVPLVVATSMAAAPICVAAMEWRGTLWPLSAGLSILSIFATYVSVASVGRWTHRQTRLGKVFVAVAAGSFLLVPLVAEGILQSATEVITESGRMVVFGPFSPIGTTANAWMQLHDSAEMLTLTAPGVMGQLVLAVVLLWAGGWVGMQKRNEG